MSELLHTLAMISSWMSLSIVLGLALVAMTAWAAHYFIKAHNALPEGYIAVDKVMYEVLKGTEQDFREENEELCKKCFDQGVQLDNLATPKPDRVKPVIDWIGMSAIYTDYDGELRELEIGWLDGGKNMGHSTLNDISEAQARELNEDFKLCIRSNHQPARFA